MYKHPEDKRAQRRKYYREHREKIQEQAATWYREHKDDPEFKQKKAAYMRGYRRRKRLGL